MFLPRLVTPILLLVAVCFPLSADTTGQISGTVTDPSGAAISAAAVSVAETRTGVLHNTTTNPQGAFSLLALPIGTYQLTVQSPGFQAYEQTGIALDVNSALQIVVQMTVGGVNTKVVVEADPIQVETINTQIGDVIQSQKIEALPLNGRNYTDLLGLQPGVVPVSTGSATSGTPSPVPGNVSVSGGRESANGFQVNGANVEYAQSHGAAIVPNLDSIAEFRLLTNGFEAEYGNYSGGFINAITKSGTNDWHGSAFDFLRNNVLDSRNFFDPSLGVYRRNQFGGTLGGRLVRDKLFFFVDYQGTRQLQGLSTGIVSVPSSDARNGIVADPTDNLAGSVGGSYWAQTLSQRLGYAVTNGEPYYSAGCTSPTSCVFPNGVIPQAAFSAPSRALLPLVPLPNNGAYYASSSNNNNTDDNMFGIRVDAVLRPGLLTAYFYHDLSNTSTPFGSNSLPGFPTETVNDSYFANLALTTTLNPTTVNELRASFTRYVPKNGYPTGSQLGVKLSYLGFQNLFPDQPSLESPPSFGTNTFGLGYPFIYFNQPNNTFEEQDLLSKMLGTHNLKFGVDVHRTQVAERFPVAPNGSFGFNGSETGNDFADFLIGAPSSFAQQSIVIADERSTYIGLFAQDSWRVKPSLTINYGLRWERSQPWHDTQNRTSTIVAGQQSTVYPSAPTGLVFPGDQGVARTIAPTRNNDFAPRIGIAFSPSSDSGFLGALFGGPGKSSFRSSYGIFYSTVEGLQTYWTTGEAPFAAAYYSIAPPLFEDPFVTRGTGIRNASPFPFSSPQKGQSFNFSPYLPINGYPFFANDNVLPYTQHYDFSFQRELKGRNIFSVAYVGTQSHHLPASTASNLGNPALCLSLADQSSVAAGSPTCGPYGENQVYTRANGTVVNSTRTPFSALFGDNALIKTIGNSNYNSLQTSLRHQSDRLNILIGYTYSKSIDDGSGIGGSYLNPFNYQFSRSLSAFDMKHNFVASYDYRIPFDRLWGGPNSRVAAGWRIVGVTHITSGLPISLSESDDHSLLGAGNGGTGSSVDLPDYNGTKLSFHDPRSGLPYFSTAAFSPEALATIGSASRRSFYGPGFVNTDLSLIKDTKLTERINTEFRAEFFNVFNHASFYNPNGTVTSSLFGVVTRARDPRIGQLALKISF